jgi:hypothetical protein
LAGDGNHQGTGDKRETASTSYFYPGETALLPHWVWVILLPVLGAAGLAALLAARRPQATVDDDTELFTRALHHWAVAAYEVRQSPREMKRFLNRLRFAAAGRAPDLPDDVLVGLAVLEHAGADPELKDAIKKGASGLRNAIVAQTIIDARSDAAAVSELINQGLDPDELAASGLAPFDPTAAQVETFLALWQGVKVEG